MIIAIYKQWEELLSEGFLFPNDMPCGKEKK